MLEHPSASTPAPTRGRPSYAGIWVPIVTPFLDNAARSVDHGALYALVSHYRAEGIAGFVACGSTGEAAALTDQEQADVFNTVHAAADGLPVVMGLSGSALAPVRERMLRLAGHHPAAFLMPAPSYIRPSQAGLLEYFTALADASPVPLLLYDHSLSHRYDPDGRDLADACRAPQHPRHGRPFGRIRCPKVSTMSSHTCHPCLRSIHLAKESQQRKARPRWRPLLEFVLRGGEGGKLAALRQAPLFFLPATQIQGAI
ncbi:dihydrodipicolinate synthase family protein [Ralstonia solanacearum]|nr:dihydrodipicolinate synthase family protein [Ralstonia solanacearum]MDC6252493.1 dihydrodipicolinate synthase family protein [Ralstonia solanacearum]MDC6257074.1 dihydrodipicolinate synthase family protein [Ralstonia solanacearum]MDC6303157.1 dihydrodipicolinate synthase family protein [Ralstonia solanacearum]